MHFVGICTSSLHNEDFITNYKDYITKQTELHDKNRVDIHFVFH